VDLSDEGVVLAYNANTTGINCVFAQEKIALNGIVIPMAKRQRSLVLSEGVVAEDVKVGHAGDDFNLDVDSFEQIIFVENMSVDTTGIAVAKTDGLKTIGPAPRTVTEMIGINLAKC